MIENFHTHTYRCKHAYGYDREYVETAIAGGLKRLGFSDHVPQIFKNGYVSNIRMLPSELDEYFSTLGSLRDEYRSDIEIFIGFEAEYTSNFEQTIDMLRGYPVDYLILGQHFIGTEPEGAYMGAGDHDERTLEGYVDTILEAASTGRFSYIAHPDLICTSLDRRIYDYHMTRLCRGSARMGIPLEINGHGYMDRRNYPDFRFFELARKEGCEVIIGCDAHVPQELDPSMVVNDLERIVDKMRLKRVERLMLVDPLK